MTNDQMVKFKIPHPGEGAHVLSKREYEVLYNPTCELCEQVNRTMGKHVLTYYAFDSTGAEVESLSLCLECRFLWLKNLVDGTPGLTLSHINGIVRVHFEGIVLDIDKLRRLRTIKGGDVV